MPVAPEITRTIDIPDDVTVTIENDIVKVSGPKGTLEREFKQMKIKKKVLSDAIELKVVLPRLKEKSLIGTWESHIFNMIRGVEEGYEYKMKIFYSHFPIKTSVKGEFFVVENFLGENFPRKARILPGTEVKISGENVTLTGIDKEKVGQTAANIEQATRIRGYDYRVFQDGIYITKKG